eukprot:CAMPEP_0113328844 /NCGR_PEP_ID=MMETSP0010_2-20120614/20366_1 /TAXON_ID=216773 ORGANISM="Corethron hystrix, Strain 308" /NCGR_SAMPLE_ID=MMETSP0010_2 /ASSEMBLY_ACC=CAM_ASM_000155 /LENGTH=362 /DNA_ID=CAMNT_0000190459 /DNA_START=295 /DNA_END=1386 /DNA_ORIENTATION=+ /assembly_acc=CAM_ASM_000155
MTAYRLDSEEEAAPMHGLRLLQLSSLNMVLGGGGGLFGIGTPEVVVIVLIGYFVLGPTELYKITKQIGKTVTEFRQTSAEATAAIQQNMDDSFQIDEIRRAADELNDAFSFRRSINYDDSMSTAAEEVGGAAAAAATMKARKEEEAANIVTAPEKRKKMIRRKKRKVKQQEAEETPIVTEETSLEPPFPPPDEYASTFEQELDMPTTKDDEDTIHRTQRRERLEAALSDDDAEPTSEEATFATSRFQAQMSGQWNSQILDKEEELSPIATIMNQLALLEEERLANQRRLEEEFRERGEMDEEYFLRKREVLEAGAAQIQEQAYSDDLAFSAVEQFADEGEDGVSTVSASSATSTQKSYLDSL